MWPRYRSVTRLCGCGLLILSDHVAKFGVHRSYGTVNNGVCNIISDSISNSNSKIEVPMPWFTNGHSKSAYRRSISISGNKFTKSNMWIILLKECSDKTLIIFRLSTARIKIIHFLTLFFKLQVSFLLNLISPFTVMRHYILWTKGAHQSRVFQT